MNKEVGNNGLTLQQELERHKRWLKDLNIRYKELQSKLDKMREVIPKVINGLLGYEIDLNTVIPILEKLLKEE